MAYPDNNEALALLSWAGALNPGPWIAHSKGVARAAERIAGELGLNEKKAYALGLLHDIGRYEGLRAMHHILAGHDLLTEQGWDEPARICLTHSFPDGNIKHYAGQVDVTEDELARIRTLLAQRPYDDYDRLIQLCDAISFGEGVCLMEKRLIDVAMRHGLVPGIEKKWQAWFDILACFNARMGKSVYSLFPECAANTLEL